MKPRTTFGWKTYRDTVGEARWSFLMNGTTLFKSSEGYGAVRSMKKALMAIINGGCKLKAAKTTRGNPYYLLVARNGKTLAVAPYLSGRKLKDVNLGLKVIQMHPGHYIDVLLSGIKNCVK